MRCVSRQRQPPTRGVPPSIRAPGCDRLWSIHERALLRAIEPPEQRTGSPRVVRDWLPSGNHRACSPGPRDTRRTEIICSSERRHDADPTQRDESRLEEQTTRPLRGITPDIDWRRTSTARRHDGTTARPHDHATTRPTTQAVHSCWPQDYPQRIELAEPRCDHRNVSLRPFASTPPRHSRPSQRL